MNRFMGEEAPIQQSGLYAGSTPTTQHMVNFYESESGSEAKMEQNLSEDVERVEACYCVLPYIALPSTAQMAP